MKLAAAHPSIDWPAESTIGEVLKRAGLTLRPQSHASGHRLMRQPFASVDQANQTWCAGLQGPLPDRRWDKRCVIPLTITDAHSRYLLRCHIVPKCDGTHVAAVFDACFREHGLPFGDSHRQRRAAPPAPRAGRA